MVDNMLLYYCESLYLLVIWTW